MPPVKLNYPIEVIFDDSEYVVKIFCQIIAKKIKITYLTNYGRYINACDMDYFGYHSQLEYKHNSDFRPIALWNQVGNVITIENSKKVCCSIQIANTAIQYGGGTSNYSANSVVYMNGCTPITLVKQPKLTYKMPKMFLNVIDAFQKCNTDLMQECCKRFFDMWAKNDQKDKIIIELQVSKEIAKRDKIIDQQRKIIEENDIIINKQRDQLEEQQKEILKLKNALKQLVE